MFNRRISLEILREVRLTSERLILIMAQIDDLNAALATISSTADALQTDFSNLEQQLQTANQNPQVDLSGPIATAQAISTKLQAIASAATEPAAPSQPAAPEPGAPADGAAAGDQPVQTDPSTPAS